MISCQTFRTNLRPDTHDAELLEHLRACDECLEFAVTIDPDNFFRAIGGDELTPPGGVDAFVGDVMAQVRSRQTETSLEPKRGVSAWRRFAIAATIAAGVTGTALVYRFEQSSASHSSGAMIAAARPAATRPVKLVTKPVVETYDSQHATILEVPSEGTNGAKVVMIFDDTLPADL